MGLFGGSTTYVSSVVYNTAGDYPDRTDYQKYLITTGTLTQSKKSAADCLIEGTLKGPGVNLKAFYRWAQINYIKAVPESLRFGEGSIDVNVIADEISAPSGQYTWVETAYLGYADYREWAEAYVITYHPDRINTNWVAEIDDNNDITIIWEDFSLTIFTPSNYDINARYIYARYYFVDNTEVVGIDSSSDPKSLIYKIGGGIPAFNALASGVTIYGGFFPSIPVRISNKMINEEPQLSTIYDKVKSAYKKATSGSKLDDLIASVEDNPDLADIDYAYLMFGVSLNTKTNDGKHYIFEFLKELQAQQLVNDFDYTGYASEYLNYQAYLTAMHTWQTAFNNGDFSEPKPAFVARPNPAQTEITITTTDAGFSYYNFRLAWKFIIETTGSGLGKVGAKVGEFWINKTVAYQFEDSYTFHQSGGTVNNSIKDETFEIFWQVSLTEYRKITVVGMIHQNLVYKNKYVEITSDEALDDTDDSGFILPLHYSVLSNLPLAAMNQVSIESQILVFNCYTVVKQKWYQTAIFKIVLVVVVVGISVMSGGAGLGAAPGLLGTNAAVGASLGLTGTTAAIAGAIANAVVAMIVTQMITSASRTLFGDKIGSIIGAVLSVVVVSFGSNLMSGGTTQWGSLMRADNLLKLTEAGVKGYTQGMQLDTAQIYEDITNLQKKFETQLETVEELLSDLLGGGAVFDPLNLVEKPEIYLNRTLLNGSEIVDISNTMISNFVDMNLDLTSQL